MTAAFGARYEYRLTVNRRTMPQTMLPVVQFVHAVPEGANWAAAPSLCNRAPQREGDAPDGDHPEVEFRQAIRFKRLPECPACWSEYERHTGAPRP